MRKQTYFLRYYRFAVNYALDIKKKAFRSYAKRKWWKRAQEKYWNVFFMFYAFSHSAQKRGVCTRKWRERRGKYSNVYYTLWVRNAIGCNCSRVNFKRLQCAISKLLHERALCSLENLLTTHKFPLECSLGAHRLMVLLLLLPWLNSLFVWLFPFLVIWVRCQGLTTYLLKVQLLICRMLFRHDFTIQQFPTLLLLLQFRLSSEPKSLHKTGNFSADTSS